MHRFYTAMRAWLRALLATGCPPDPLDGLSPREWADLPFTHPPKDECGC